jgi:o-succinylbenzoate synthase
LHFKKPAGTSRGFLTEKPSWLVKVRDKDTGIEGIGECSIIAGLSIDPPDQIEDHLALFCNEISSSGSIDFQDATWSQFPAARFAFETALLDLKGGGNRILYNNSFSRGEKGIRINGLVWMSSVDEMVSQAREKIAAGFTCLKFKIGALDFESEIEMLQKIRTELDPGIEIRLDANGAFSPEEAMEKLEILSGFNIHSIEQPIKPRQWENMAFLCASSPIPIALDEELIGVAGRQRTELLNIINPQYIILKPSLLGGVAEADDWIKIAEPQGIEWWATSALESNIGLNAIAQWVANKNPVLPQGLGTGSLFVENFPLPLEIKNGELWLSNKVLG